jgi:alanine dehydrogenase
MVIGVPKELKDHETRVALVPSAVLALREAGHSVVVETHAGEGSSLPDEEYARAGATIIRRAYDVWSEADLIVKVKEPEPSEYGYFRPGLILFTYLHLAPLRELTDQLVKYGVNGVAYETIVESDGSLPLLTPMSEVAGRMAVQAGAHYLEIAHGGRGLLLGGVPGVAPGHVAVIGAGVVGTNALQMAIGLGARVTVLDKNTDRLRQLDLVFGNRISTVYSTAHAIEEAVLDADLVIGGVLVPGAAAPKLVTRSHIARMKKGAVVVDVAIDQGGCFETSHATTHAEPVYTVDGVVHYCVANMPGAVARTSTFALNNAPIGHALALANKGWKAALKADAHLRNGLNVCEGRVTYEAVARDLGYPYTDPLKLLG